MIPTVDTLTLISTGNTRIEALAILLVAVRFPTPAPASVDPPLHINETVHLHLLINVTIKHMRIPTEHLLNDLFALLLMAMIVVARETVALAVAVSLVLEALAVEFQTVTATAIAGDATGSGSRRRVPRTHAFIRSLCRRWDGFGSRFRF